MLNINILAISSADPLNFGPLIYGFVILLATLGALVGFWRGFMRQTVRSITILISAIISYAIIPFIYNAIDGYIGGKNAAEIQTMLADSDKIPSWLKGDMILSLDSHTVKLFASVPIALIVMPIIFVVLFAVINKLMLILHKIICAFCGFKSRRNTFLTRILGFLLGCLQGAAIAGVILMPVIGIGNIARESHEEINRYSEGEQSTANFNEAYAAYVKSVSEHPLIYTYGILGINALYEGVATARVDGTEMAMTELLPDAVLLASDAAKFSGVNSKALTPEEESRIITMIKRVESNPILTDILASSIRSGSFAYENGSFPFKPDGTFDTLILSTLEIFHTTAPENLANDLYTMADIYFLLSRNEILTGFNDGADVLVEKMTRRDELGNTTAEKLTEIINSNDRLKPILTMLTKLSITVMQNGSGIDEKSFETFESIKSGINTSVLTIDKNSYENEEDYVADVSSALDETLKTNGIELEKEIVDGMADYVADNYSEETELTDEQACEIILNYYDSYLKYKETGEMPEELPNGNAAE